MELGFDVTVHPVGSVGFDTNQNCTDAAAALRAYGFRFGVRYVCQENSLTNRKIIRPAEYRALLAAGIDTWLVSEWYTPSDSPSGTPSPFRYGRDLANLQRAADEDCDVAFRLAADCGHTGLLLHAVDWDATGNKTAPDMVPYLDRCLWRQMQTPHPFGIYCGGRMLRYLIDVHGWSPDRVTWWQASAWSSRFPEPEAHVLQTQQFPVGGVTVDLNTVYRPLGQGAIVQPKGKTLRLIQFAGRGPVFIGEWYEPGLIRQVEWIGPAQFEAYKPFLGDIIQVDPAALVNTTCIGPAPTDGNDWPFFRVISGQDGLQGPPGPSGLPGAAGAPGATAAQVTDEIARRLANG